ncbi:MAG: MoaD/ThiS family protein [Conexivisphaerales archaeon]
MVKVRLFFELMNIAGKSEIERHALNLEELIESLSQEFGKEFFEAIYDQKGVPREYLLVYVNDKHINYRDNPSLPLNDTDIVLLIPPVGGGRFANNNG